MATCRTSARHCCVPQCVSDDRYSTNISFHKIPKDESLRKQWIIKIRRDEGPFFKITEATVVCSEHFKPDDFKWTPVRKTLKKGAVPSVFKWVESRPQRRVIERKQLAAGQEHILKRETPSVFDHGIDNESTVEPMDTREGFLEQQIKIKSSELKAKTEECGKTTETIRS